MKNVVELALFTENVQAVTRFYRGVLGAPPRRRVAGWSMTNVVERAPREGNDVSSRTAGVSVGTVGVPPRPDGRLVELSEA